MSQSVTKIVYSVLLLLCITHSAVAKDPPKISAIKPTAGAAGTEIIINGQNFSGEVRYNRVRLGKTPLKITSAYPNQIRAIIPKKAATGRITVEVKNAGSATSAKDFVVMAPLNVKSISASYGAPGSTITITGSGFSSTPAENSVILGGEKCKVVKASPNELLVRLPNKSMSGRFLINVENSGKIENRNNFLVAHKPIIRTFKPSSGTPGTEVSVTGMHFGTNPDVVQVRLGGRPCPVVSVKDKKVVIKVPKEASTGPVQLAVNNVRSDPTSKTFEVREGLVATKMEPLKVFRGQEVRIFGRGFSRKAADNKLTLGKTRISASRVEKDAVVFSIPESASTGKTKVVFDSRGRGTIDIPVPLTIQEPALITRISPVKGEVGEVLTINGRNFGSSSNNVRVIIGGKYAHVRNVSPNAIMANIPKGAASGASVTVQTRYFGTAVSRQKVTVEAPASVAISKFSPTAGPANEQVQIEGQGFSKQANQNRVFLGRVECKVLKASTNKLMVQIPANATTNKFRLWVGKTGYAESGAPFNVSAPKVQPPPMLTKMTITSITPTGGKVGTYVTINGTGFTSQGMRAYVGRAPAGLRVYTQNRAMIAIPNNSIGGPITLVGPTGAQARSKEVFKMMSAVSVNKFYPNRGRPGDKVTIYGSDFKPGATQVYLGQQKLRIDPGMNSTMLVVQIPQGAASGPFRVSVTGKADAKSVSVYKVLPPVTSVPTTTGQPAKAEPLFTATKDDTPVMETLMKEEPKQPADSKTAPSIDELLGFESAEGETLQISSIEPTKGPAGETITINGSGFGDKASSVSAWVGNTKAKVLGTVPDMIMIEAPSGAKGKVKLKIAGKPTLTSKQEFEVIK